MYERGVFSLELSFRFLLLLPLFSLALFLSISALLSRSFCPLTLSSLSSDQRAINSLITFFFATPLLLVQLSVFLRSSASLLLLCSSYSASSALSSLPLLRGNLSLQRVSRSKLQSKKRKYIFALFDAKHDEHSTSTLSFFQRQQATVSHIFVHDQTSIRTSIRYRRCLTIRKLSQYSR